MNKKQMMMKEYELRGLIKHDSLVGTKRGCAKCWKSVTREHFIVMCEVVWYLVNNGYEVFTEVEFKNGGRADIVAMQNGQGFIIEVLHTETQERYEAKFDKYPEEFTMISVQTGGFDHTTFAL